MAGVGAPGFAIEAGDGRLARAARVRHSVATHVVRRGVRGHQLAQRVRRAPGIEVRPLRTIYGTAEFSEMFLDEVRVPVANRVGAENDGWRIAMVTFSFERGTAFVSEMLHTHELLDDLVTTAKAGGAWDDA